MRTHLTRIRIFGLVLILGAVLGVGPPCAHAAVNSARGGIGGIDNGTLQGGDGTGSAQVALNVVDLALVKQARDLAGQVLPQGALIAGGSEVWFLLYVDNPTQYPVDSLQVTDALDEAAFTYVPGTIAIATVSSGSSDAATWAAAWSAQTDDPGAPDDVASIVDTGGPPGRDRLTLGAVPGQVNRPARIPPLTRLAVRFRARVN
jgi:hypothetical protein